MEKKNDVSKSEGAERPVEKITVTATTLATLFDALRSKKRAMAFESSTGCCELLQVFGLVEFALKLLKAIHHPFANCAYDVGGGNLLQQSRTLHLRGDACI